MGKKYTRDEIWNMCQEALEDTDSFYTKDFINYQGTVSGENTYYTEVVAEFVIENIEKFRSIESFDRKDAGKSYNQHHTGEYNPRTNRIEEKTAMDMFQASKKGFRMDYLGRIVDYQVPLKSKLKDFAGKIDLLSEADDAVYILELKTEDSKETLLRCILEAYTYLQKVDAKQLFADFDIAENKSLYAAPLVFKGGRQWGEMQESVKHPKLIQLMKELDIKGPFYLETKVLYDVKIE